MSAPAEDLAGAARAVEAAARALARGRRALAAADALDPICPLDAHRAVAGKRGYEALARAAGTAQDRGLAASLARWARALTLARVAWDQEVALSRARRESSAKVLALLSTDDRGELGARADSAARGAHALVAAGEARRARLVEAAARLDGRDPHDGALARLDLDLLRAAPAPAREAPGLLVAPDADLIAALASELSPAPTRAPDAALPAVSPAALVESAARFLDASTPLTRAVLGRAHRARDGRAGLDPLDAFTTLAARHVPGASFPARLSLDWLGERFAALVRPRAPRPPMPHPLGASSFVLAAARYGEASRREAALRFGPLATAHDPFFVDAHRVGALFALSAASRAFLARELGAGRGAAHDAERALFAALLLTARVRAVAILVAREGWEGERARDADVAMGGPLARIGRVAPSPADDEPARWLALLTAPALHEEYVARFDEDYYRNPRAGRALEGRASLPALATTFDGAPDPVALAVSLAAAFERSLG